MTLVWVTGSPGVGKSTVCEALKARNELAIDADWEGYNHWVNRASGQTVTNPPYPVPPGWLARFAWRIDRSAVETLVERTHGQTAFLFGAVENEMDVWDLFEEVICLVADNGTLRERLLNRTTNPFGQHPEELAAAIELNRTIETNYRRYGATIIDGTLPPDQVAEAILHASCPPAERSE
jgi:shikimate kinase